MKTVKVKVNNSTPNISESSQRSSIKFSFLKRIDTNSYEELHARVKCREYVGEVVFFGQLGPNMPGYAALSLKRDDIFDTNETLLNLRMVKRDYDKFIDNLDLLNSLEKSIRLKRTVANKVEEINYSDSNGMKQVMLIGSKLWQSSPLLIGVYSFLLRLMTYPIPKQESLLDLIKFIGDSYRDTDKISEYGISSSDAIYCHNLNYQIDISFFLNNFRKIISKNKLTGIDDQGVRDRYETCKDGERFIIGNGVRFYPGDIREQLGLSGFCYRVQYHSPSSSSNNTHYLGEDWVKNYHKLYNSYKLEGQSE